MAAARSPSCILPHTSEKPKSITAFGAFFVRAENQLFNVIFTEVLQKKVRCYRIMIRLLIHFMIKYIN